MTGASQREMHGHRWQLELPTPSMASAGPDQASLSLSDCDWCSAQVTINQDISYATWDNPGIRDSMGQPAMYVSPKTAGASRHGSCNDYIMTSSLINDCIPGYVT